MNVVAFDSLRGCMKLECCGLVKLKVSFFIHIHPLR